MESIVIVTDKNGMFRIVKYSGDIMEKVRNRDSLELIERTKSNFKGMIDFIKSAQQPESSSKKTRKKSDVAEQGTTD